jgi:hypothetical protein
LPGNDDIVGVPARVDDGAKVAHGGVVEVAAPFWFISTARCLRWTRFALMSSTSSTLMLAGRIHYPLLRPHLHRVGQLGSRCSHLA